MLTPIHLDPHITLRPFREGDAAPIFEIIDRDREYLAEFLPWVEDMVTVEDEAEFVENTMSRPTTGTDARASFVIEYQSEIAGTIEIIEKLVRLFFEQNIESLAEAADFSEPVA